WRPFPVEYKRGRPKPGGADEVQLCAQALCLEEMLGVAVPRGALFYGTTRRRKPVEFDEALRRRVAEAARRCHELIEARRIPRVAVPLHHLGGVVCFGPVSASPELMAACVERGIGLSFLDCNGRFLARVEGPAVGNVLLRRHQYRLADDPAAAARLARAFVVGK